MLPLKRHKILLENQYLTLTFLFQMIAVVLGPFRRKEIQLLRHKCWYTQSFLSKQKNKFQKLNLDSMKTKFITQSCPHSSLSNQQNLNWKKPRVLVVYLWLWFKLNRNRKVNQEIKLLYLLKRGIMLFKSLIIQSSINHILNYPLRKKLILLSLSFKMWSKSRNILTEALTKIWANPYNQ